MASAARLIVNADDFGLTRGVNRAIAELHDAGVLTSATLMATGNAFDDAVEMSRTRAALGVGCHVVLTDGKPVSHPADIPSLIGPDGKTFRPSLADFLVAVLRGRVREEDIAREAMAQVRKLQRAGLHVTHLDTHKHTHILPAVARPLLCVAEWARVRALRNPFEQNWSLRIGRGDTVRRLQVRMMARLRKRFAALPQIRSGTVFTTDGTIGISATGKLDAACLTQIVAAMPPGQWELVCHPGYNDRELDRIPTRLRATREIERSALLAVFAPSSSSPQLRRPELIHYGQTGLFGALPEFGQFTPDTENESLT